MYPEDILPTDRDLPIMPVGAQLSEVDLNDEPWTHQAALTDAEDDEDGEEGEEEEQANVDEVEPSHSSQATTIPWHPLDNNEVPDDADNNNEVPDAAEADNEDEDDGEFTAPVIDVVDSVSPTCVPDTDDDTAHTGANSDSSIADSLYNGINSLKVNATSAEPPMHKRRVDTGHAFRIYVSNRKGQRTEVWVQPYTTVLEIKEFLSRDTGRRAIDIHLIFRGRNLPNSATVASAQI